MAPSKRPPRWLRGTRAGLGLLLFLALSAPNARAAEDDSAEVQLQLEVRINNHPLNVLAAFALLPDGQIASPRSELQELGIAVPTEVGSDDLIPLKSIQGLSYVYDQDAQTIDLELPDASRIARKLDSQNDKPVEAARSGTGLVINYSAYASANYDLPNDLGAFNGSSISLDARAFSPYGTLSQSAIVGSTTFSDFTALRLDTTWSYSDQGRMLSYNLGDIVSGGLAWTRPVRMGGAQIRRNFDLRPDLVTMPLPQIEGSAAVPSTLQVFVGSVQTYSSSLQPGPFAIDSLPVYTNAGTARVVLTDSAGQVTESEQEFYTSPELLKRDLYDFSVEAGVVRRDYGTDSFGYDTDPALVGSFRYGVTNSLTGEAHVEAQADLIDIGIGGLFSAGRFGMISGAIAGSLHDGDAGLFLYAGWEGQFGNFSANLSTSRTFGDYKDLAAVTEERPDDLPFYSGVPVSLDQIALNYSIPDWKAGLGVALVHKLETDGTRTFVVSGSYSQSLPYNITGFVNGFASFGDDGSSESEDDGDTYFTSGNNFGVFVGLSMPLGANYSGSTGLTASDKGWAAAAEVARPMDNEPNAYGWRVAHGEGDQRFTSATGTYRGSKATVSAFLLEEDRKASGNLTVDGSAVFTDGDVFLGSQIQDSFVVVDAGAPDVKVEYENRYAGSTGRSGKLLISNLRSYEANKVSIDVNDLPVNASVVDSELTVVPTERAGLVVSFGVKPDEAAALVILSDANGQLLKEGTEVLLNDQTDSFVVGYEGQVYLTGLNERNELVTASTNSSCRIAFDYTKNMASQSVIGPMTCQ